MPQPPASSTSRPVQPPLTGDDRVPCFRGDLKLVKRGPGLFDVEDAANDKCFQLYDFEVSLARMLNGQRKASEVVEEGVRLGIPVTLDSLRKFVRQLELYGFLAQDGGAQEAPVQSTWDKRDSWDPAMRELYQSGLRLLRVGRPSDALGYFQAMLETDPQNPQALEMKALAESQIAGGTPGGEATTQVHAPRPSSPALPQVTSEAEPVVESEPTPEPAKRGVLVPALGGALVVALSVGGFFAWRSLSGAPKPETPLVVAQPVAEPARVDAGIVAADAPVVDAGPSGSEWRETVVRRIARPLLADVKSPATGAFSLFAGGDEHLARGSRVGTLTTHAGVGPALAAADKKVAELEVLAKTDAVYVEFLERARKERERLARGQKGSVAVLAPVDGVFAPVTPSKKRVGKGEVIGAMYDGTQWEVVAALGGDLPTVGSRCELRERSGARRRVECRVAKVSTHATEVEVVARVAAADADWLNANSEVGLRVGL